MIKALMIINPKSGMANSKKNILPACEILSNNGYDLSLYFTKEEKDAYKCLVRNRRKYDVVIVVGGDGTINEVTNAVMRLKNKPKIAYFPSGTMNDFGSNFDLTNDYIEIANRIIKGKTKQFDVSKFNNQYFNYVAGFGSFTDVSYKTKREAKETLGSFAYVLEGMGSFQKIKPTHTKITIDNKKTEEYDVLFGLVFSGSRVAGLELNKKGNINDGLVNVLLLEYTDNIFDYGNYLALFTQQENKYLHWYKGSEINFEFNEDVHWTLDGEEVDGKDSANIKVEKRVLEMLY